MIIGGYDVLIEAHPEVQAADVIIRSMRYFWRDGYFQDGDQEEWFSLGSSQVQIRGGLSREFFIYQDIESIKSWNHDGATSENVNSMLHFLIGDRPRVANLPRQVTLVCGSKSGSIQKLVSDLTRSLGRGRYHPQSKSKAA